MEQSHVQLTLQEYLELCRFKENIEKGLIAFRMMNGYRDHLSTWEFATFDEAFKQAKNINDCLVENINKIYIRNEELSKEINSIKSKNHIPMVNKEVTLSDVRKMSYWQFRKWKSNK